MHFKRGRRIVLIGHVGHPEVIGTMGQLPPGAVTLVSSLDDVERLAPDDGRPIAFVTQTTLSVDDTREIVAALKCALSGDPCAAQRGHLLRDHQPPGGGEDRGA